MKKLLALMVAVVLVMAVSVPVFAHPMVPDNSIGNVSVNAANGLHTAHMNTMEANGVAHHVFEMRFMPAGHHHLD